MEKTWINIKKRLDSYWFLFVALGIIKGVK